MRWVGARHSDHPKPTLLKQLNVVDIPGLGVIVVKGPRILSSGIRLVSRIEVHLVRRNINDHAVRLIVCDDGKIATVPSTVGQILRWSVPKEC